MRLGLSPLCIPALRTVPATGRRSVDAKGLNVQGALGGSPPEKTPQTLLLAGQHEQRLCTNRGCCKPAAVTSALGPWQEGSPGLPQLSQVPSSPPGL